MQVILTKDVEHLGGVNELVVVKNGYARNYLIPQHLAIEATTSALKNWEEKQKVKAKKEAEMLAEIKKVITVLQESPVKIKAKTGTSGKIFGSVTSLQIARAIHSQKGYDIDRKRIHIADEVKELGTYKASVNFGNGQITEIEFEVIAEEGQ